MKTKQSLIKSQVFSSIEKNLPRTGSKDVLQSGSHVRGDAMRGHEFSMPGAVKTPRPVTELLLTVLRRAISMDVDILVRTLHSFLVWKSLPFASFHPYRKRHSFLCWHLPSDRAHAQPRRDGGTTATTAATQRQIELPTTVRFRRSPGGRVRRKRRARCATAYTVALRAGSWLRSAPPP